ncbi:TlpA family protein disulfide reductase [Propionibacterium acidifaciens]
MPDRHGSDTGPGAGAEGSAWTRFRRSPLFTLLVLTVTAGVAIAGVWLVNHHGDAQEDAITAVQVSGGTGRLVGTGQTAPGFTATTIDGRTVTLSALRGRPVWLVFEASWCASCRSEAPDVEAAYQHGAEAGLEAIGLYLSEDSSDVQRYVDALGLTYTQVPDEGSRIAASFGIMGIPSHVFIDADGVVQIAHPGALSASQMIADVNEVTGQG